MGYFALFFIFILGSIVGSFLNVLILRYNTGRSIVYGRSTCFSCDRELSWQNLIPVFSFLFQGGRCSACQSKISGQYILVELLTAAFFLFMYVKLGLNASFIFYTLIFSLLIIIAVYDFRHKIIPDDFVSLFIVLAFARLGYVYMFLSPSHAISSFLGGTVAASFLGILWLISSGRWMGFGDVKLVLGLGWLLPFCFGITLLIYSFWIGAVMGILINVFFKRVREIPFAPFLIAGFVVVFFFDLNLFSYFGEFVCLR